MRYLRVASIPEREKSLKETVKSMRPQVDSVFVMLNGYDHVPSFLNEGEYIMLDNSTGSAAKFYDVETIKEGYIFICDDDIAYPSGYVINMIKKIHQYNGVVSLHGKTYPRPVTHFTKWSHVYRCLGNVDNDAKVDMPGTGVLAFKAGRLDIKYSDFKTGYMSDTWMCKLCYEQNVPVWAIAHKRNYLRYFPYRDTIWRRESENKFQYRTELLKSFLT
jgi:hypothetical protein